MAIVSYNKFVAMISSTPAGGGPVTPPPVESPAPPPPANDPPPAPDAPDNEPAPADAPKDDPAPPANDHEPSTKDALWKPGDDTDVSDDNGSAENDGDGDSDGAGPTADGDTPAIGGAIGGDDDGDTPHNDSDNDSDNGGDDVSKRASLFRQEPGGDDPDVGDGIANAAPLDNPVNASDSDDRSTAFLTGNGSDESSGDTVTTPAVANVQSDSSQPVAYSPSDPSSGAVSTSRAPSATDSGDALAPSLGGGDPTPGAGTAPAGNAALGGLMGNNPMQMFFSAIKAFLSGDLLSMLKPGGLREGKADEALAKKSVERTLANLDLSKDNVLLSIQGTGVHELDPNIAAGVNGDTTVANVDYQSDIDMSTGVATAKLASQMLTDKLTSMGKNVSFIGYSQGAMAVGQLMADKKYHEKISKALLVGHPVSSKYQYDTGADSKVKEVNADGDAYAGNKNGKINQHLDIFSLLGGLGAHGSYDFRALTQQYLANSFG